MPSFPQECEEFFGVEAGISLGGVGEFAFAVVEFYELFLDSAFSEWEI